MKFPCELLITAYPHNSLSMVVPLSSIATVSEAECFAALSSRPPSALINITSAFQGTCLTFQLQTAKCFPLKFYFEPFLAKIPAIQ